ncbi:MAG: glycosyltransferase family 4 protein [Bacillota bacterium]|nr:glycosyltransferase family 4 protein [Bacillota bacterium]
MPPDGYGPWEQVVAGLAEGLVARGHEVTVFASGDSRPAGRLEAVVPEHLGAHPELPARELELLHVAHAFAEARRGRFDLLHNHLNCHPLVFTPLVDVPVVTTLHGSAFLEPATRVIYRRFADLPYVAISRAEREALPELRYVATVPNGIRLGDFPFAPSPGRYLAFYGRLSPKKGADRAVAVAERAGLPLRLAGPVPPEERAFFEEAIRPRLRGRVEYVGEVRGAERARFLGGALALLQLNRVPEPFGLAMVEAMACGVPVVGTAVGAIPEVVADRVTGRLVTDGEDEEVIAAAVRALAGIELLDRAACRRRVESFFTVERMVEGYERVYEAVTREGRR